MDIPSWFHSRVARILAYSILLFQLNGCYRVQKNHNPSQDSRSISILISTDKNEIKGDAWVSLSAVDCQELFDILDDAHGRSMKELAEAASDTTFKHELEQGFSHSLAVGHIVPVYLMKIQKGSKPTKIEAFDSHWRSASRAYKFSANQIIVLDALYKRCGLRVNIPSQNQ